MTAPEVDWDAVHRSNYERSAFWDSSWTAKARDLYVCAKKLEPELLAVWESYRAAVNDERTPLKADYYTGVYFMLLAYAVENLLKAAAVARHKASYRSGFREKQMFPAQLKKHDLVKLAQLVKLDFDADEEDLLRRLTRSAVWYGRYPVPLEYSHMAGKETFLDGDEYSVSWFGGNDVERLNAFVLSLPGRLSLDETHWHVPT